MKKCLRQKCQKEFEPNKPKQVFCSATCRVYFSREKHKEVDERKNNLVNAARGRDENGINNDEIEKQIFDVDSSTLPPTKYGNDRIKKMVAEMKKNEIPRLKGESSIEYRLRMIELLETKNTK